MKFAMRLPELLQLSGFLVLLEASCSSIFRHGYNSPGYLLNYNGFTEKLMSMTYRRAIPVEPSRRVGQDGNQKQWK
jgi:hypothetical protein